MCNPGNISFSVKRIEKMEFYFDTIRLAFKRDAFLLEDFYLSGMYRELVEYYFGESWKRDLELDENGMLPADLKKGVLSQDGVYDLICEIKQSKLT